jgi:hypothetical protein
VTYCTVLQDNSYSVKRVALTDQSFVCGQTPELNGSTTPGGAACSGDCRPEIYSVHHGLLPYSTANGPGSRPVGDGIRDAGCVMPGTT